MAKLSKVRVCMCGAGLELLARKKKGEREKRGGERKGKRKREGGGFRGLEERGY